VALPVPPTTLIGRDAEVAFAVAALDPAHSDVRLLTLLGPGGVGKTRLAIATATALGDAFADGVAFVDLSPLRDHRLVAATIAQALNVHEADGRSARELLLDQLHDQQLLLVLDNFEHLLDANSLVADLLSACPSVRALVTSRTALRLRAERRDWVPPLALADDTALSLEVIGATPAVRLLLERAQVAAPELELNATNANAIHAICRRLEGIPLAIELAAARLSVLSPAALLTRLERRLPLLTGGSPDLPLRQQTVRGTLAWSCDLLGPSEQSLLRRLALFVGGCTLESAESVCAEPRASAAAVPDQLTALVDASLIQRHFESDASPRFTMLETVREFALERLAESGELDSTRRRYLDWSLHVAQPVPPDPPERARITRMSVEYSNLRAALGYAIETGAMDQGLWLAVALTTLWFVRGAYGEGRGWLAELLRLSTARTSTVARAHALTAAGHLAHAQGDFSVSEQFLQEAAEVNQVHPDDLLAGLIFNFSANNARRRGELDRAAHLFQASLDQFQKVHHQTWAAWAFSQLALVAEEQGDTRRAAELAEHSLALFEASGNTWGASRPLRVLGRLAAARGDRAAAQQLHEAALAQDSQLGDTHGRALSLVALANDVLGHADVRAARRAYAESLALADSSGNLLMLARGLEGLARFSPPEHSAAAVRLAGAANTMRKGLDAIPTVAEQEDLDNWLEVVRGGLGEKAFVAAWAAGQMLEPAQAVTEGLLLAAHDTDGDGLAVP
jgi:predicted ATPase